LLHYPDVSDSTRVCPICKKPVRSRPENAAFPFCSSRCKQVDLGRWLDEAYRLPAEESTSEEGSVEEKPS
jgi:endogenous inhibitor of DNA gyrase (YacG/DUF329 family)